MDFKNVAEYKAFLINEILAEYAQKTGKSIEAITHLYNHLEEFKQVVDEHLESAANGLLDILGIKIKK